MIVPNFLVYLYMKKRIYTKEQKEAKKANTKAWHEINKEYREANKNTMLSYGKEYYIKNKEHIIEQQRIYVNNNKEQTSIKNKTWKSKNIAKVKSYYKDNRDIIVAKRRLYTKNNRNKIREYDRLRQKHNRLINPLYKLKGNLRNIIRRAIINNGYKKTSKTHEILGCSYEYFKAYLESKFESWMNWDNYGKYNGDFNFGWDIDHIESLAKSTSEDYMLKLNHYLNLQPLCSKVNRDIKRDLF